jgi:hypothetical protein
MECHILQRQSTYTLSTFKYLRISARIIPNGICTVPPEDEQVMPETCTGT